MRTKDRRAATTTPSSEPLGPLRVLVADDDQDTASSPCRLVRSWGYDARGTRDGAAALGLALAYRPDVLLLDVAMPGVTGHDVARRLREAARFEDALLVAVTGYADDARRFLAAAAGFDHYLVKPVTPSTIERLLKAERVRLEGLRRRAPRAGVRAE